MGGKITMAKYCFFFWDPLCMKPWLVLPTAGPKPAQYFQKCFQSNLLNLARITHSFHNGSWRGLSTAAFKEEKMSG